MLLRAAREGEMPHSPSFAHCSIVAAQARSEQSSAGAACPASQECVGAEPLTQPAKGCAHRRETNSLSLILPLDLGLSLLCRQEAT